MIPALTVAAALVLAGSAGAQTLPQAIHPAAPAASASSEVPVADAAALEDARARVQAQRDAQTAACQQRFAVNDCLRSVQAQGRADLAKLRQAEHELHARERGQRAAEQAQQIHQKQQDHQQALQAGEADAKARLQRLQDQQQRQARHAERLVAAQSAASASEPVPETASAQGAAGPNPAAQAENRARYAEKRAQAERKRAALARRLREAQNDPSRSAPLPLAP